MEQLDRELRFLGVRYDSTVVIEAGYQEHEIRNDGLPRANARPQDPAIIVSFESKHGPLRYGCDTFTEWVDNLRAIALALEALRAVDRYGVTKRGEQYKGWLALPSTTMSADEARRYLHELTGLPGGTLASTLYRTAAKLAHPDTETGSREAWEQVQRAKQVLGV